MLFASDPLIDVEKRNRQHAALPYFAVVNKHRFIAVHRKRTDHLPSLSSTHLAMGWLLRRQQCQPNNWQQINIC
jgi:hypothetical protein